MTPTRDRLRAIIRDRFSYDPAIYPDADKVQLVADLKLGSVDVVELVMAIEDDFGIEIIADGEAERFAGYDGTVGATFGELVALVDAKRCSGRVSVEGAQVVHLLPDNSLCPVCSGGKVAA